MGIPDGTMYHDGHLSAGTVERQYEVLTESAGAEIPFGAGVVFKDGNVVPATKASIYGVAIKRSWSDVDHFYEEELKNDKWHAGEALGVLVDGTINVPVSEDVNRGELATVDANGLFKPTTGTDAVGRFLSSADKGSTARVIVRAQFAGNTTGGADPNHDDVHAIQPPTSETPSSTGSGSNPSGAGTHN